MGQYSLIVPYSYINQIRSNDADTFVASVGLQVMNAEGALHKLWPSQVASLGKYTSGSEVRVYLRYDNVDVPGPTDESADGGAIYWNLVIANAGHAAPSDLIGAISSTSEAVAGALLGTGNIIATIVGGVILGTAELVQLLSNGCDGVVAAQNWAFTDQQLTAMTNGVPSWVESEDYPGSSSPIYCSSQSNYSVSYQIASGSGNVVPKVVQMAWSDAASLLSRQGFQTYVKQYITSQKIDVPTVVIQNPQPGTMLFEPLAEVDVTLLVPPKGGGRAAVKPDIPKSTARSKRVRAKTP